MVALGNITLTDFMIYTLKLYPLNPDTVFRALNAQLDLGLS
jgi:hypothetical protein